MSLLLCRYRKFKNGYTWGPLVPALQKAAGHKVTLLRKDVEAEARKALEQEYGHHVLLVCALCRGVA